ncbi:MAG: hypothetical protein F4W90_09060 [Gammaproteobacteria bacterium]|nr:hypothetical protein [Gammaproteobacteria bacterium]
MAYERNCAVCGFDLRLGDANLGLEAAHIQWHAYEGPDKVDNGIALCTFHHKAFDRGAFKLEPNADCYRIIVSQDISGGPSSKAQLTDYHGLTLHQPQTPQDGPQLRYAIWHANEVFHGPERPL